jgi:hypothetical protein
MDNRGPDVVDRSAVKHEGLDPLDRCRPGAEPSAQERFHAAADPAADPHALLQQQEEPLNGASVYGDGDAVLMAVPAAHGPVVNARLGE